MSVRFASVFVFVAFNIAALFPGLAGCSGIESAREDLSADDPQDRIDAARYIGEHGDHGDAPRLVKSLETERDLARKGHESATATAEKLSALTRLSQRDMIPESDRPAARAAVKRALKNGFTVELFAAIDAAGALLDNDMAAALMDLYESVDTPEEALIKFLVVRTLAPLAQERAVREFLLGLNAKAGEPGEARTLAARLLEKPGDSPAGGESP